MRWNGFIILYNILTLMDCSVSATDPVITEDSLPNTRFCLASMVVVSEELFQQ
jgi:hypothetical protein